MAYLNDIEDELTELEATVWTDTTAVALDTQQSRQNFNDLVNLFDSGDTDGLQLPFTIYSFGQITPLPGQWSLDRSTYKVPLQIWRIDSTNDEEDISQFVRGKLEAFRDALINPGSPFTNFWLVEDPTLDFTQQNAVNLLASSNGKPVFGSYIAVDLYTGEPYG